MKSTKKSKIIACKILKDEGASLRGIGRTLRIDHHTVGRYLNNPLLNNPEIQAQLAIHRRNEITAIDLLISRGRQRLSEYLDQETVQPIPVLAIVDRSFNQRQLLESRPTVINTWERAQELKAQLAKLEEFQEFFNKAKIGLQDDADLP